MTIVLDGKSLNTERVEQIRGLAEETGLAALPAGREPERPPLEVPQRERLQSKRQQPGRRQPDEFTYTLVYMAGEVVETKVFPESEMPETLRPLIRFLSQMARHATRR